MISAAVIVILLAATASLGSWLFSQWVGARRRSAILVYTFGGAGLVLMIGTAALAVIVAPQWWEAFVPRVQPASETGSAATLATQRVGGSPLALMRMIEADWPATACVNPVDSGAGDGTWFIDNDCEGVVAVVLAWCQLSDAACEADASAPQAWRYEPAGIVMISATQRPSPLRLGDDGPLIAATYALKAPTVPRRQVVFLACYITAPEVHSALAESHADVSRADASGADVSGAQQRDRLQTALSEDECYARVARWSQVGQRQGRPPDALLRRGIDG